jgi:hypothetical protein
VNKLTTQSQEDSQQQTNNRRKYSSSLHCKMSSIRWPIISESAIRHMFKLRNSKVEPGNKNKLLGPSKWTDGLCSELSFASKLSKSLSPKGRFRQPETGKEYFDQKNKIQNEDKISQIETLPPFLHTNMQCYLRIL